MAIRFRVKHLSVFIVAPLLGGCPGNGGIGPGVSLIGQTPIVPTTGLQVGRLYFEGVGRKPVFQLADGTVYSEICYADFQQTAALQNINKYIVVNDTPYYSSNTTTIGDTYSLNVTGIKVGIFSVGANGSYNPSDVLKTENARGIRLTPEGVEIVRKSIRPGCRNEIANKKVVLVADAVRADTATLTTDLGYKVGGNVGFGSTGSGVSGSASLPSLGGEGGHQAKSETSYKLVYVYLGTGNSFVP